MEGLSLLMNFELPSSMLAIPYDSLIIQLFHKIYLIEMKKNLSHSLCYQNRYRLIRSHAFIHIAHYHVDFRFLKSTYRIIDSHNVQTYFVYTLNYTYFMNNKT